MLVLTDVIEFLEASRLKGKEKSLTPSSTYCFAAYRNKNLSIEPVRWTEVDKEGVVVDRELDDIASEIVARAFDTFPPQVGLSQLRTTGEKSLSILNRQLINNATDDKDTALVATVVGLAEQLGKNHDSAMREVAGVIKAAGASIAQTSAVIESAMRTLSDQRDILQKQVVEERKRGDLAIDLANDGKIAVAELEAAATKPEPPSMAHEYFGSPAKLAQSLALVKALLKSNAIKGLAESNAVKQLKG